MKKVSVDTSGTEKAQKAIAEAQLAATNLAKNFKTDLSTENLTTVNAGGTASDIDTSTGTRRRKTSSGLSSQLGITY